MRFPILPPNILLTVMRSASMMLSASKLRTASMMPPASGEASACVLLAITRAVKWEVRWVARWAFAMLRRAMVRAMSA